MQEVYKKLIESNLSEGRVIDFEAADEGLYVIEVKASAKSEKQLGEDETDDEDLRVEIDGRGFGQFNNPSRLLDSPAAFSGGKLHGGSKTVYFCMFLSAGKHVVELIPDKGAFVEWVNIRLADSSSKGIKQLEFSDSVQAGESDRQPWLTYVLVDLPLKNIEAEVTAEKRWRDSDDVKLIVDEDVKLELWSDRTPTLNIIKFEFGEKVKRVPTVYDPVWTGDFMDDTEQMILARAIFGEARDARLSDKVREGIGWSIRHRVGAGRWNWGGTYFEIITQSLQYSAFNDWDPNRPYVENPFYANKPIDRKMWFNCHETAGDVMNGLVDDPTSGSNHYYDVTQDSTPDWIDEDNFVVQIDTVRFYKL